MNIQKANNQYYGQYIEENLVNLINHAPIVNNTGFSFNIDELSEMNQDIQLMAALFPNSQAHYVGRQTKTASCDLYIDDVATEVKYVSSGTGTYYNTSLSYFHEVLGFTDFKTYTNQYICPFLEQFFGVGVYDNFSPVSQKESSAFQKTKDYDKLKELDKAMRIKYVNDLYDFLNSNPEKWIQFLSDMISKESSNKVVPEQLLVFNHTTKQIRVLSQQNILNCKTTTAIKKNPLGFSFDRFNIQIGWQNGSGLNNPTIRVFLK